MQSSANVTEIEIPEDVAALIEEYAQRPHYNSYSLTPVQERVMLECRKRGLTWNQTREALEKLPDRPVPGIGWLGKRYRQLVGG